MSLGYVDHRTGHHQAIEHYNRALALFRAIGNAYQAADSPAALGHPHAALGQHGQARAIWRQALDIFRRQGRTQDAELIRLALAALAALDALDAPSGRRALPGQCSAKTAGR